ncbi:unnamed protein product [Prorocentrum cordatum]|uniref:Uncharacterized protein n=1 Tax=Prorocentrum cordatum TaxID=2364126 RepID=A0ABN9VD21_9DINO|nr:unnamed protein product [Polarella glacialis]
MARLEGEDLARPAMVDDSSVSVTSGHVAAAPQPLTASMLEVRRFAPAILACSARRFPVAIAAAHLGVGFDPPGEAVRAFHLSRQGRGDATEPDRAEAEEAARAAGEKSWDQVMTEATTAADRLWIAVDARALQAAAGSLRAEIRYVPDKTGAAMPRRRPASSRAARLGRSPRRRPCTGLLAGLDIEAGVVVAENLAREVHAAATRPPVADRCSTLSTDQRDCFAAIADLSAACPRRRVATARCVCRNTACERAYGDAFSQAVQTRFVGRHDEEVPAESDEEQDEPEFETCCFGRCRYRLIKTKGGRLGQLLKWDVKAFVLSNVALVALAIWTSRLDPDFAQRGAAEWLHHSPQFKQDLFWCKVLYGLLSLPFLPFSISFLCKVLTHCEWTGFNEKGACVAFEVEPRPYYSRRTRSTPSWRHRLRKAVGRCGRSRAPVPEGRSDRKLGEMAAGGGQAARAAAEPPCAGGSLWPARRSRQAAARAACAGRLQAALARVTVLEAECARLQAELGHALDASQAVATAAARAAAQEARGSAPLRRMLSMTDSADLDGKRDPLLRAAAPEVVARLALVAPVMAADLLNEPAATLDVGRRNVVRHGGVGMGGSLVTVAALVFEAVEIFLLFALLVLGLRCGCGRLAGLPPAARSAAEGVSDSWEVACRRGRSLPAGDLEHAEQGSARQLACHEFGGGLKELDGFNHSAAGASAASSAPPSACDADFVVAEGPEALTVGAAADDVDDGQGDASVVFISADGLEEGPEEEVVEEVHGDVLELVVGDAAALAPAPQLGAAVRARLRLDRLRLQVVKGAAVPIDDRDLRRPGWQAADAAAGVEVPPTPAQQREGLRWVRRLLADPGAWHGGAVWEPESIEEAARRIDGEGSRRLGSSLCVSKGIDTSQVVSSALFTAASAIAGRLATREPAHHDSGGVCGQTSASWTGWLRLRRRVDKAEGGAERRPNWAVTLDHGSYGATRAGSLTGTTGETEGFVERAAPLGTASQWCSLRLMPSQSSSLQYLSRPMEKGGPGASRAGQPAPAGAGSTGPTGRPAMPSLAVAAVLLHLLLPLLGAAPADLCACLNWKQVYMNDLAKCGEGLELYPGRHFAGYPEPAGFRRRELAWAHVLVGDEYQRCDLFFKRLDRNFCVNVGPFERGVQEWFGGTWCYVGPGCAELNGGTRLAELSGGWQDWLMGFINDAAVSTVSNLSWKLCTPGEDARLQDVEPASFLRLAAGLSLNLGYGLKLAYPSVWNYLWSDLAAAAQNDGDPHAWSSVPDAVRGAVARREPVVLDSQAGGGGDLHLLHGRDTWHLRFDCQQCPSTCFCWSRGTLDVPELGGGGPIEGPKSGSGHILRASA